MQPNWRLGVPLTCMGGTPVFSMIFYDFPPVNQYGGYQYSAFWGFSQGEKPAS